ncbi:hypothetical protein DM806_16635 [Sphingobium lactosutens]|uniref:hypothetical protein n=1 Tax=Sphingobium lactosutens TaxID=522773 RepID=UPI0015B98AE5|nr:hypothetical protein [Sphingobium lactosutens]NWK97267.1 hypothetical protein [Sphingobium lactosutens]
MTDDDIDRLATGFLACALPKERWTHEAHFATALWLMLKRPDIRPERDMPNMIRRYNESVGGMNSDTSGYHETITQASLHMARRLIAGLPDGVRPAAALAALMASPLGDKDWPFTYWSRERLMSVEARRDWVAPDLMPLPE